MLRWAESPDAYSSLYVFTSSRFITQKKIKRFLSKSNGCRVVKSTTGLQCNLTRNKYGMVTRLTC